MSEKDIRGLDLVRAAIERDRGGHLAPQLPINICGDPDPNAMRADDPRWPGNRVEPVDISAATRVGEAILSVFFCPGCLALRFGPGHLSRKLAGIDCSHV